jgi:hypothetical protein
LTFGVLAAVAASSSASNDVAPGVLGFLVVAAMGVALVFLLRSMNKQFRKITPDTQGTPGPLSEGSEGPSGSSPPSQLQTGSSSPSQHQTSGQEAPR